MQRISSNLSYFSYIVYTNLMAYFFIFIFFFSIEGKTREVKLDENFFTGYRKTIVGPSEILINILIPFTEEVKNACIRSIFSFL